MMSSKQHERAPNSLRVHLSSNDYAQISHTTTTTTSAGIVVTSSNNTFKLIDTVNWPLDPYIIVIPNGTYTTQEAFLTALQNAVNAVLRADDSILINFSVFNNRLRVQLPVSSPPWKISFLNIVNSAATIMSFNLNSELSATVSNGVLYSQNTFSIPTGSTSTTSTSNVTTDKFSVDLTEYQCTFDKDRPVYVAVETFVSELSPGYCYSLVWDDAPIWRMTGSSQKVKKALQHIRGNTVNNNLTADALGMLVDFPVACNTKEWSIRFTKHDGTDVDVADLGHWLCTLVFYQR